MRAGLAIMASIACASTWGCGSLLGLDDEPGLRASPPDATETVDTEVADTEVGVATDSDALAEAEAAVDAEDDLPPPPASAALFLYDGKFTIGAFIMVDTNTAAVTPLDVYDMTGGTPLFGGDWDHVAGDADLLVFHSPTAPSRSYGQLLFSGKWKWIGDTTNRAVDLATSLGPGRIVSYVAESGCLYAESTSTAGATQIANDCPGLKYATHLLGTPDGDVVLYKSSTGEGYRSHLDLAGHSIPGWKVNVFGAGWKMLGIVGKEIIAVGTASEPRKRRAFHLVSANVEGGVDVAGTILTRDYEIMTVLSNRLLMFFVGEGATGGSVEYGRIDGPANAPTYVPVKIEKDHIYNGYWSQFVPL
jgi:hypothetical protein